MGYKPLYNKVLLKLEEENTTALVVEPDLQNAVKGIITSVGLKKREHLTSTDAYFPPLLNAGDKVFFFIRDARKFKIDDEEYYLINDEDILVVEK